VNMKYGGPEDLSSPDPSATVIVTVAPSRPEAELIVGMLRSGGLRACIAAHGSGARDLRLSGVQVLVAPDDEEAARQFLASTDDSLRIFTSGTRGADGGHHADPVRGLHPGQGSARSGAPASA
jgi:hypothetical protein